MGLSVLALVLGFATLAVSQPSRIFSNCHTYDSKDDCEMAILGTTRECFGETACDCIQKCARDVAQAKFGNIVFGFVVMLLIGCCLPCWCFFFICGRWCCNCCGGKQPREGCCCPGDIISRYTASHVWSVKGFAIFFMIVGIIGVIVTAAGDKKIDDSIDSIFDAAKGIVDEVSKFVDSIFNAIPPNPPSDIDVDSIKQSIIDAKNDIRDTINDEIDKMRDDEKLKQGRQLAVAVVVAVLALGGVMFLLGLIAALANVRKIMPMFSACFLMLFGAAFWILLAFVFLIHFIMGTVCLEVKAFHNDDPGPADIICDAVSDLSLVSTLDGTINSAVTAACDSFGSLCRVGGPVPCSRNFQPYHGGDCYSLANMTRLLASDDSIRLDGLTVANCAGNPAPPPSNKCATATVGDAARDALNGIGYANQLNASLAPPMSEISDCSIFRSSFIKPVVKACDDVVGALTMMLAGLFLYCLSTIAAIILLILGAKRFLASHECYDPLAPQQFDGPPTYPRAEEMKNVDSNGIQMGYPSNQGYVGAPGYIGGSPMGHDPQPGPSQDTAVMVVFVVADGGGNDNDSLAHTTAGAAPSRVQELNGNDVLSVEGEPGQPKHHQAKCVECKADIVAGVLQCPACGSHY